jgi:plastocyanin
MTPAPCRPRLASPTPRVAAGAVALVALAGLAGCSSSGKSSTSSQLTSSTTSTTSATSTTSGASSSTSSVPPAGPDGVNIANFAFAPKTLTVKVGTTVTWKNDDQFAHQVKSTAGDPGVAFALGSQAGGQTVSHMFTQAGTYRYYCNIHNYMTGTIVVTP